MATLVANFAANHALWFLTEIGAFPRRFVEFIYLLFADSADKIRSPQFSLLTQFIYLVYWFEFSLLHLIFYASCLALYLLCDPVPDTKVYKFTYNYDCSSAFSLSSSLIDEILERVGNISFGSKTGTFFHLTASRLLSVGHLFDPLPASFTLTSRLLRLPTTISRFSMDVLSTASIPETSIIDTSVSLELPTSLELKKQLKSFALADPTTLNSTFTHLFCVAKTSYFCFLCLDVLRCFFPE